MKSKLNTMNLNNKNVLLRTDLNIPLEDGAILDDYKLINALPTLKALLNKGAHVLLVTHIGRPMEPAGNLSTKNLIPWFEDKGLQPLLAETLDKAHILLNEENNFVILENIRFFPGETTANKDFAKKLASLTDYYVNDAFSTMHRNNSSITLTPLFFAPENRTIGLSAQCELDNLGKILSKPEHPFALILGGAKLKTKLGPVKKMLDSIDILLLGPAIAFSFLKSQGYNVGRSLIDNSQLEECKELLTIAQLKNVDVVFPIDFQIGNQGMKSREFSYVPANEFPDNAYGINIGPQTLDLFAKKLKDTKTIVYNGLMGDIKYPATIENTCRLFKIISEMNCYSVIAGGDSIAAARMCSVEEKISHSSPGGGATLSYLSGDQLPGIKALRA